MRDQIISKYIQTEHIYDIIGHDVWLYIQTWLQYSLLIIFLGLLYVFAIKPMNQPFLQLIWAVIGFFVYVKCLFDIFDDYLDTLVATDKGLIHFRRDGLWKQKSDLIQRVSMEALSHEQNSFFDTLVNKGDLFIKLEDTSITFRDISDPALTTNSIIEYKEKILGRHNYLENEQNNELSGKYNVLIEALGEVVSEYVEKKNNTDNYY